MKENDEKLMCLKSQNGPESASDTFDELEKRLPGLKGRRFYGLFKEDGVNMETYLACTRAEEDDSPEKLGLTNVVFKAGKYNRRKIVDWESKLDSLNDFFSELEEGNVIDHSRYSVEYYRSMKELYIMVPIE